MSQVHSGAYVSLLAPGKIDYTAITRNTFRYAYARQTQVN